MKLVLIYFSKHEVFLRCTLRQFLITIHALYRFPYTPGCPGSTGGPSIPNSPFIPHFPLFPFGPNTPCTTFDKCGGSNINSKKETMENMCCMYYSTILGNFAKLSFPQIQSSEINIIHFCLESIL